MPVIAITLHVIAVIVWIGGMFLGIVAVRPALAELDLPTRARLFAGILGRFLPWVWGAVVTLLATGFYMVFTSFDGGLSGTPWFVRLMMGIGIFMMMLMGHVTFAPFKRLKRAIAAKDETLMTKAMKQMGMLMAVNLALGLVVILAAMMGAYFSTD
ncbi:MAG TPA: CopD family protein [Gammaproteobacteria bacterium]